MYQDIYITDPVCIHNKKIEFDNDAFIDSLLLIPSPSDSYLRYDTSNIIYISLKSGQEPKNKNQEHVICHDRWIKSFFSVTNDRSINQYWDEIEIGKNRNDSNIDFSRKENYQKNIIKVNMDSGLAKQNYKNDLLTKSFEGSSQ
jgi:hypothetical protein